jgi:hypothetical protein
MTGQDEKSPRTTLKLVALATLAATVLMALAWVNLQNVRDAGPTPPSVTRSGS